MYLWNQYTLYRSSTEHGAALCHCCVTPQKIRYWALWAAHAFVHLSQRCSVNPLINTRQQMPNPCQTAMEELQLRNTPGFCTAEFYLTSTTHILVGLTTAWGPEQKEGISNERVSAQESDIGLLHVRWNKVQTWGRSSARLKRKLISSRTVQQSV